MKWPYTSPSIETLLVTGFKIVFADEEGEDASDDKDLGEGSDSESLQETDQENEDPNYVEITTRKKGRRSLRNMPSTAGSYCSLSKGKQSSKSKVCSKESLLLAHPSRSRHRHSVKNERTGKGVSLNSNENCSDVRKVQFEALNLCIQHIGEEHKKMQAHFQQHLTNADRNVCQLLAQLDRFTKFHHNKKEKKVSTGATTQESNDQIQSLVQIQPRLSSAHGKEIWHGPFRTTHNPKTCYTAPGWCGKDNVREETREASHDRVVFNNEGTETSVPLVEEADIAVCVEEARLPSYSEMRRKCLSTSTAEPRRLQHSKISRLQRSK